MNKKIIAVLLVLTIMFRFIYFKFEFDRFKDTNGTFKVCVLQNTKANKEVQSYVCYLKENNKFGPKFILNIYSKEKKHSSIYNYGDVLYVQGKLKIPKCLNNEGEFDYKKYLNSKKIYGTITSFKVKKIGFYNKNPVYKLAYDIRNFLNKNIENALPQKEGNLLKSMLYGDTRFLDKDLSKKFEKVGITHLLAVSGSNVATIILIARLLLKKAGLEKKCIEVLLIVTVIIFTIISNLELSIVRASLMTIIMLISKFVTRKYNVFASIGASLYLMLLNNPYCILNVGMQLSFLATLGIVMYYTDIKENLNNIIIDKIKNENVKNVVGVIIDMLSVTLAAFVLILPVQLYYFNSINFIMFISNIIAVFIADVICNIGFIALFCTPIPIINFLTVNSTLCILKLLIWSTEILSKFSFLDFKVKAPNRYIIILYYIFVVSFYLFLKYKKRIYIQIREVSKYALLVVLFFSFLYNIWLDNYIIFFNVGQGDCSLIKVYNNVIVIDCGSTSGRASGVLSGFLKKKRYR